MTFPVPNNWQSRKLEDLMIKIIDYRGKSVPKADSGIPLITARNIRQGFLDFTNQEYIDEEKYDEWMTRGIPMDGDILFTTEAPLGCVCRYPKEGKYAIGQRTITLRTNAKVLNPDFLLYFFLSKHGQRTIDFQSTGSTAKGIKASKLKKLEVNFPSDLNEQRRIATVIETWDKAIEKMEQKIAAKKRVKEGLALKLLLGEFSSERNRKFQKTRFFKIPTDWEIVRIEEVATQVTEKNDQNLDLPVLSCTKHVGLVDSLKFFKKQVFSKQLDTYRVVRRDQFVYATNHIEEGSIGLQNLYESGLVSPMYTVFKTDERILSTYLYALLKTELFRCIFEASTSASVDRRGSLRWKVFKKIEIPLPPIKEQQFIAQILTKADSEVSALGTKLYKLKEQRNYLLDHLITGRIRAPENMPISKS